MNRKNWKDMPDIIGVKNLMDLFGVSECTAKNIFHARGFPKIQGTKLLLADKSAVMEWVKRP